MIIAVDPDSAVPVYEQLRVQVVRMVTAGTLEPETRLPTIRQLAADLGVAKGTVSKSYELLEADGVIATRGRKGSFVCAPTPADPKEQVAGVSSAAETLVMVARQLGLARGDTLRAVESAWDQLSPSASR